MDPFTIITGCGSLIAIIGKSIPEITGFVVSFRDARQEIDAVKRELHSLEYQAKLILHDCETNTEEDRLPESLRSGVTNVLENCVSVVDDLRKVINDHEKSPSALLSAKWATTGKESVRKLRSALEAHRGALSIALDFINVSLSREIKEDTDSIKRKTNEIHQDTQQIQLNTQQILDEIARLRAKLPKSPEIEDDRNFILKKYLETFTLYAESVAGPDSDLEESVDEYISPFPIRNLANHFDSESIAPPTETEIQELSDEEPDSPDSRSSPVRSFTHEPAVRAATALGVPIRSSTSGREDEFRHNSIAVVPSSSKDAKSKYRPRIPSFTSVLDRFKGTTKGSSPGNIGNNETAVPDAEGPEEPTEEFVHLTPFATFVNLHSITKYRTADSSQGQSQNYRMQFCTEETSKAGSSKAPSTIGYPNSLDLTSTLSFKVPWSISVPNISRTQFFVSQDKAFIHSLGRVTIILETGAYGKPLEMPKKTSWGINVSRNVSICRVSYDGTQMAAHVCSGLYDYIWLVSTTTGDLKHELKFESGGYTAQASFSPDGKYLVTMNTYKRLQLWDTQTGKEIQSANSVQGAYKIVVASNNLDLFIGMESGKIEIWALKSLSKKYSIEASRKKYDERIVQFVASPTAMKLAYVTADGKVGVFYVELDQRDEWNIPIVNSTPDDAMQIRYSGDVREEHITISDDGMFIGLLHRNTLLAWNTHSKKLLHASGRFMTAQFMDSNFMVLNQNHPEEPESTDWMLTMYSLGETDTLSI